MNAVERSGTGMLLQHPGAPGSTRANWRAVADELPDNARPVLIAYRFMEDEALTVDIGERDGDVWLYLGGGPINDGQVCYWADVPQAPALPAVLAEAA